MAKPPKRGPAAGRRQGRAPRGRPAAGGGLGPLDAILIDDGLLQSRIGLNREQFDYLLEMFSEEIDLRGAAALFGDGGDGALARNHALLLSLMYLLSDATEDDLADMSGSDPATIHRYVEACMPILEDVLPTPERISGMAARETAEETGRSVPGGKPRHDSSRTPREPPADGKPGFHTGTKKRPRI